MQELIWLNGAVSPLADARISVEDRGFQFADGVYEVVRAYGGRCFALMPHIDRLERSADGIKLRLPINKPELCEQIDRLIERSELDEGIVYIQLTRGVCKRNHVFPDSCPSTLLFYTRAMPVTPPPASGDGIALQSVQDVRWRLCWIKSIALLANVLARNEAMATGAEEAVFVENGIVSECSTSNLFIVHDERLITHPVGPRVLPGITRAYLLDCASELRIPTEERAIHEDEAIGADEILIASTAREVSWVSRWNGKKVGASRCGPITETLHRALRSKIASETRHPIPA